MHSFTSRKRIRKSFGSIDDSFLSLPNLIEVQKKSYNTFLDIDFTSADKTIKDSRLIDVFNSVFPIEDNAGTITIEFVDAEYDFPKYEVFECIQRGATYSLPIKAKLRLILWDNDEEAGTREIKSIKEQLIYLTDVPLMTDYGTFVINGSERVIVSQMHRSPGVYFDHDGGSTHSSGKLLHSARVIPYRGSWLDYEFDAKEFLNFRIDRKRKIHVASLLYAIGYDAKEILSEFYNTVSLKNISKEKWVLDLDILDLLDKKVTFDVVDAKSGDVLLKKDEKLTRRKAKEIEKTKVKQFLANEELLFSLYLVEDIVDNSTGEVLFKSGEFIDKTKIDAFEGLEIKEVKVISPVQRNGFYILNSILADKSSSREEALMEIYRVLRPGEPPTVEVSEEMFNNLFFNSERYDLSKVGRMKLNETLGLDVKPDVHVLTKEDILASIKRMIDVKDGYIEIDDIDNLGNRRVRSVGELVENEFRLGLLRMEKNILERVTTVELEGIMPNDLINSKPLSTVLKDFFSSSQLSQFMDQTNPLSEVTHKRRLSALGPGGLTRERAGFEVRDVHPTHYGRICPIETPEGPNIGLINSIASYATVNEYGFIETPYRKVVNGEVTDEVQYLSALEENKYTIAQSDAKIDESGKFAHNLISCRRNNDFVMASPAEIDFADVSPKQIVSVAASLIPFLENDDANRALMGSNMMRQAVPVIKTEAPLVGTGMEATVAKDSGSVLLARNDGFVDQVDSNRIVINIREKSAKTSKGVDIYNLRKYQRTNQNTCINQKPLVKVGDYVNRGDIIADAHSTDLGELALGQNLTVAFMPWNGYNFEDSILLSERIVKEDIFTSIHIEEFEVVARDTKLGPEEITRDIPNVAEENLIHLDETGVVHIGAEVKGGDILVGKVTPKSESPMTAEEKLLRAIFGEKAADVRDTSLKLGKGLTGTVVEVRVFSRRGIEKDERAMAIEMADIERLKKDKQDELKILTSHIFMNLKESLVGSFLKKAVGELKKGQKVTKKDLNTLTDHQLLDLQLSDKKDAEKVENSKSEYDKVNKNLEQKLAEKIDKIQQGDDLATGVLKMVKVFVAIKRKMQPGDKMAGRHGNKGVVSKVCPVEDMPFLEDGREVDIVLNPLGVPSRMNVGQILETHLGWASREIGMEIRKLLEKVQTDAKKDVSVLRDKLVDVYSKKEDLNEIKNMNDEEVLELSSNLSEGVPMATPVFDGARVSEIDDMLYYSGNDASGQVTLIDGRTGEEFDRKVTVGVIYMLKLHHLVDEKIHARSIGPYSLVTQQPLGGKSHQGGQRFGEMECWALEAYGASYTLQELLTVKSDDVTGRTEVYKSIIKGEDSFSTGMPESFNVMVKELRSLGLNLELRQDEVEEE